MLAVLPENLSPPAPVFRVMFPVPLIAPLMPNSVPESVTFTVRFRPFKLRSPASVKPLPSPEPVTEKVWLLVARVMSGWNVFAPPELLWTMPPVRVMGFP